ncbi:MAG TPA: alpha/beta hydrolase [Rhabdochlamydiaceae bacterium]|nr:alpha/beta hydrolase [Rhabdochlamydiaceae bacterium]
MFHFRFWFILLIHSFVYASPEDSVICIHGLFAGPWTMQYIAKHFEKDGYQVKNWGYPSLDRKIEEHAENLVRELKKIALEKPGRPMQFIAHSLGCLVLRSAVNHPECPGEAKMGKVVLLAPPNQGSSWARLLEQSTIVKKVLKEEAGKQVLTENDFKHLGEFPPSLQVLVIAGNWGINPFIQGENDGTIAVNETYLDTPHDHIVISTGHKTILMSHKALILMREFLK